MSSALFPVGERAQPVMLNCHTDVVAEGDPTEWEYPPFGGDVSGWVPPRAGLHGHQGAARPADLCGGGLDRACPGRRDRGPHRLRGAGWPGHEAPPRIGQSAAGRGRDRAKPPIAISASAIEAVGRSRWCCKASPGTRLLPSEPATPWIWCPRFSVPSATWRRIRRRTRFSAPRAWWRPVWTCFPRAGT